MIKKIVASSEILGAILGVGITDREAFKANPKEYILQTTSVDLGAVDVIVVENTPTTVHLTLPYYEMARAAMASLQDPQLSQSVGGIKVSDASPDGDIVYLKSAYIPFAAFAENPSAEASPK